MVEVAVPAILAAQAGGRGRFTVEAATLGEALRALPVADLLFDERGELSERLRVYLDGTEHREGGGLDASIAGTREIRVVALTNSG